MKKIPFTEHDNEEWKVTNSLPPNIEVSSKGRLRRYVTASELQELIPSENNGYKTFSIEGKSYQVHKLVAETFVPNPDNYTRVRHKNGKKSDNQADNLEWCSLTDNFMKDSAYLSDSRKKVYCKELDTVFGSLRSAAFCTHLPQDIISESIRRRITIAGCTFSLIEADDELVKTHKVIYVSFEKMIEILQNINCYSIQCIDSALSSELQ